MWNKDSILSVLVQVWQIFAKGYISVENSSKLLKLIILVFAFLVHPYGIQYKHRQESKTQWHEFVISKLKF